MGTSDSVDPSPVPSLLEELANRRSRPSRENHLPVLRGSIPTAVAPGSAPAPSCALARRRGTLGAAVLLPAGVQQRSSSLGRGDAHRLEDVGAREGEEGRGGLREVLGKEGIGCEVLREGEEGQGCSGKYLERRGSDARGG